MRVIVRRAPSSAIPVRALVPSRAPSDRPMVLARRFLRTARSRRNRRARMSILVSTMTRMTNSMRRQRLQHLVRRAPQPAERNRRAGRSHDQTGQMQSLVLREVKEIRPAVENEIRAIVVRHHARIVLVLRNLARSDHVPSNRAPIAPPIKHAGDNLAAMMPAESNGRHSPLLSARSCLPIPRLLLQPRSPRYPEPRLRSRQASQRKNLPLPRRTLLCRHSPVSA